MAKEAQISKKRLDRFTSDGSGVKDVTPKGTKTTTVKVPQDVIDFLKKGKGK